LGLGDGARGGVALLTSPGSAKCGLAGGQAAGLSAEKAAPKLNGESGGERGRRALVKKVRSARAMVDGPRGCGCGRGRGCV
jgi:hypothetical protein